MSDIPDWAIARACDLYNESRDTFWVPDLNKGSPVVRAFAAYIAEHEEPPLDPLIETLKAELPDTLGRWAHSALVMLAVNLRKRGIEIGKSS